MCSGGSLLAEFEAGGQSRPAVPEILEPHLTQTADGAWVVWARKAARHAGDGLHFLPLAGGDPYPRDAVATCRRGGRHEPPDSLCTCGFHALGNAAPPVGMGFMFQTIVHLDVALSGRVLAYTWPGDREPASAFGPRRPAAGVLFRAQRQTVVREQAWPPPPELPPQEPGGALARLTASQPRGAGPWRLRLPEGEPVRVSINDDAGFCLVSGPRLERRHLAAV